MSLAPILVVEDNETNMKLVRFVLSSAGYEVRGAADALEALEALNSFQPRLILMDMQLPGMDGYDLTRKLRADPRTSHVPIVALTAYAMKGDHEKALAAGCDGHIAKPFDTRNLCAEIARYLEQKR